MEYTAGEGTQSGLDSPKNGGSSCSDDSKKFTASPISVMAIVRFEALYNVSKGRPIIIFGPTGSGKSLFLDIFKTLHQEEHGNFKSRTINCSHYDDQLVRSELFGHEKGAFTGAIGPKRGILELANGGVLFMEEIGELPKDVQAKLLTVIEDGCFYRVGGTKLIKTSLQIVGTTNRIDNFREDFWHRFVPFRVPSLYSDKTMILYFLLDKHPDLLKSLKRWELMLLLTHNWPGNFRELEKVILFLKQRENSDKFWPTEWVLPKNEPKEHHPQIQRKFSLMDNWQSLQWLWYTLREAGIDVDSLENLLNNFRLSIFDNKDDLAFPELTSEPENTKAELYPEYGRRFNVNAYAHFQPFKEVMWGFQAFCTLFCQDSASDKDLLDFKEGAPNTFWPFWKVQRSKAHPYFLRLANPIFEYLSGIRLQKGETVPEAEPDRIVFFRQLARKYPSNNFLLSILRDKAPKVPSTDEEATSDIWSMKHDDLLRYYYKGMVERSGGVQEHAADKMGINYRTFRSRCKRLGMELSRKGNT